LGEPLDSSGRSSDLSSDLSSSQASTPIEKLVRGTHTDINFAFNDWVQYEALSDSKRTLFLAKDFKALLLPSIVNINLGLNRARIENTKCHFWIKAQLKPVSGVALSEQAALNLPLALERSQIDIFIEDKSAVGRQSLNAEALATCQQVTYAQLLSGILRHKELGFELKRLQHFEGKFLYFDTKISDAKVWPQNAFIRSVK
jgi:hypothetical protein